MYPAATARNRAIDLIKENIGLSSFRANLLLGKFSGRPPHISDLIHDAIATLYFPRVTSPVGGTGVGCAVSI
jgi:hypothetical protein